MLVQLLDVGDASNWSPGDVITCRQGLNNQGLAPSRLGQCYILNVRNAPNRIPFERYQAFFENPHQDESDFPANNFRARYARRIRAIDQASFNPAELRDINTVGTLTITWGRLMALCDERAPASHSRSRKIRERDI